MRWNPIGNDGLWIGNTSSKISVLLYSFFGIDGREKAYIYALVLLFMFVVLLFIFFVVLFFDSQNEDA